MGIISRLQFDYLFGVIPQKIIPLMVEVFLICKKKGFNIIISIRKFVY